MAGDLRAPFSTNDRQLRAVAAHTNREQQWQAVMLAVAEHLRLLETGQLDADKGVVRGWSSRGQL